MDVIKFEVGKTYYTRSACDHNCIIAVTIVDRTPKTVTGMVQGRDRKTFRPGITCAGTAERISPWGSGSMMPLLYATDTRELRPDWEPAASA